MMPSAHKLAPRLWLLFTLWIAGLSTASAEGGFLGALRRFDRWLEESQRAGIDTTYQDVPKLNRQVYLGTYNYWQNYQMTMPFEVENLASIIPGIRDNDRYMINAYAVQSEVDLGIDWKGLALELPIPIRNRYRLSLGLAKNGSVWGARVRYKRLHQMNGYCNVGDQSISENNTLRIFYLEGYYVLNSRKFSLSAGLFADMVQKKSAGSPIIFANYYQSRYRVDKLFPAKKDIFKTQQISVGAGYAYNLSIRGGKVVVHGSLVPMFTAYSHLSHVTDIDVKDYPEKWTEFYDSAVNGHARICMNIFARFAINYSFDRYLVSFLAHYRHYGYSNDKHLRILNQEADAQLNFGVRF